MDTERAIEIVQALADGVDPFSGERFPSGSPYQQADTVRALAQVSYPASSFAPKSSI